MINLEKILLDEIRPVVKKFMDDDIYAISFFVYDDGDDVLKPTLTVSYNTITDYKEEIDNARDEAEAKWNYAFWSQICKYGFGTGDTQGIVQQWIIEHDLQDKTEDDSPQIYDENMAYIGKGPVITQKFVEVLIDVANKLHDEGLTTLTNGTKIPILIHELEYYQAIADQNAKANPEGQADEFIKWINTDIDEIYENIDIKHKNRGRKFEDINESFKHLDKMFENLDKNFEDMIKKFQDSNKKSK